MPSHHKGLPHELQALDTYVKLLRSANTVSAAADKQIRSFGLTGPQFAVLELLYHRGPMRQGMISEKLLVTGGNVTMVIDHLEQRRLIERRVNPDDRRCSIVHLTDNGEGLMSSYFPLHAEFISGLMSPLTADEQSVLGRLARKLGLALAIDTHPDS